MLVSSWRWSWCVLKKTSLVGDGLSSWYIQTYSLWLRTWMGCKTRFGPWCCWWRCTVCCFFGSFGIGQFAVLFGIMSLSLGKGFGQPRLPVLFLCLHSFSILSMLINLSGLPILQCHMFLMPGYAITASGAWNNKTAVSCDPQINFEFCEWGPTCWAGPRHELKWMLSEGCISADF